MHLPTWWIWNVEHCVECVYALLLLLSSLIAYSYFVNKSQTKKRRGKNEFNEITGLGKDNTQL